MGVMNDTEFRQRIIQQEDARQKALRETGQVAQQTSREIIKSMEQQIAIDPEKPLMGLKELNEAIHQMNQAYYNAMDNSQKESAVGRALKKDIETAKIAYEAVRRYNMALLGVNTDGTVKDTHLGSLERMKTTLKDLTREYEQIGAAERNAAKGNELVDKIQKINRNIRETQRQMQRPTSLKNALGMDESTLDRINEKLQALRLYKSGIKLTDQNAHVELKQVDSAINKLTHDLQKYQNETNNTLHANNALTRSWNYMKNRLAFYLTVGATTSFVKQLIDVRGQYEMLERSIGILVDSAQQGTKIFAELNAMALKSPFTTMELGAAAKQLVAYDIKANEVVDTVKRLGDIAAAVGIPIERLTYALGQIKAYDYLNARDARMFSNAGIPLVKELADYFTQLEGRMVSTADIYDRIKKKAISFNDVMQVMNSMTDQGGKFFNFQEKVADTLRVKIANLTLAWNNMLNEMGRSNQGVLSGVLSAAKSLFEHWKDISNIITAAIPAIIVWKSLHYLILTTMKFQTAEQARQAVLGKRLGKIWGAIAAGMKGALTYEQLMVASGYLINVALTASVLIIGKLLLDWWDLSKANDALNKSIVDGTDENIKSIEKFFDEYGKQLKSIGSESLAEQQKMWERVQDEIETTSKNSEEYIHILNNIPDISDRIGKGEEYLKQIQDIDKVIKDFGENNKFDLGGSLAEHNLLQDLKDVDDILKKIDERQKVWGSAGNLGKAFADEVKDAEEELTNFINSLNQLDLEKSLGTGTTEEKLAHLREIRNLVLDNLAATDDGQKIELAGMSMLNHALDQWVTNQALANGLIKEREINSRKYTEQEIANIESNRTAWEDFFKQLDHDERERLEYMIEQNDTSSDEFKKIWDNASESLRENAKSSYNLIQEQIAALRATPDIVINLIYRIKTVNEDEQTKAFRDKFIKPQEKILNTEGYFAVLKRNTQKYGKYIKKEGERIVAWEKRLGEEYQSNKKEIAALNNLLSHRNQLEQVNIDAIEKELQSRKDYQEALEEIRDFEGFDYDQFASGKGKGKGKKKGSGKGTKPEDEVAKALKDELSIIKEMQSNYEKLRKVGVDATTALKISSTGYEGTLARINAVLTKFGVAQFKASAFVGKDGDPNTLLKALEQQRSTLIKSGKVKTGSLKDLDVEIQKLTVDAKTYNLQKITDGLNREFEKLHNDYELSVELDANPELGDMFADMFNIDRSKLPHNMLDLIKDAQKIANDSIEKFNKESRGNQDNVREGQRLNLIPHLDIMRGDLEEWARRSGLDIKSELYDKLKNEQDDLRNKFKQFMMDTEKDLDDYTKKYGITADRIAEIEAERLRKLKNLNNTYYDEQMRKLPEYQMKLDAINKGAAKEKDKVWFEDFKNSPMYSEMFERIENISSSTLELLRKKIRQVSVSLGELDPSQVKELTQQFTKIDDELIRRNPFKGLTRSFKDYIGALKGGKETQQAYFEAQNNYDAQMKTVAALEEQLKQKQMQEPLDKEGIDALNQQVIAARNLLKILKQILGEKEQDNKENEEALTKFSKQMSSMSQKLEEVSKIVSTIGSITEALGVSENTTEIINDIGQSIDGLAEVAQGAALMTTNPLAGVGSMIGGLWKTISGWFDNGNKRIDRKVKESETYVHRLELAYIDLERTVEKSLGNAEISARKLAIANKQAQLEQLKNQLRLEESRKKKNRDDEKIIDLQKQIKELSNEISDMVDEITNNLLGSDIKSAAEDFVNTWVSAWRQGEDTMGELTSKFDDMIDQMIMKSLASKLVANRLKPIWDMVDNITSESSEGGTDITLNELKRIKNLMGDKSIAEAINTDLKNLYGALGIAYGSGNASKNLSNLQQGIQSITEDTAGALEAYMNGVSQQVYLHSDLLTQIRDAVVMMNGDAQMATQAQMLLQLQKNYILVQSMAVLMENWTIPSGNGIRVALVN